MKKLLSFTYKFGFVALVMLLAAPAFGQVLYTNPITDPNPSAANPFVAGSVFDSNLTVSGIGRGAGIVPVAAANVYTASGWNNATIADAILDDAYFEWNFTPAPGKAINFQNLVVNLNRSSGNLNSMQWYSDVAVPGVFQPIEGPFNGIGLRTLDLSSPQFDNVTAPISFRLYAAGPAVIAANTFTVNDFTFNGFVPGIFYNPITGPVTKVANSGTQYTTGQVVNESISVSGITNGPGTDHNTSTDQYNVSRFEQGSQALADLTGDYFEWVITPNPGFKIDFKQLVLSLKISNITLNGNIQLRSSLDGFAAPIGSNFSGFAVGQATTFFVDLSAQPESTAAVTFRLYGWLADTATRTIDVTDFNFDGVVAPDPLSPPLLATNAVATVVFDNLVYNTASAARSVSVYGLAPTAGYPANVSVVANVPHIQVSADNVTFGASTTLTLTSNALHPIYIRMNPDYFGTLTFTPGITLTSASFPQTATINVRGTVVITPPVATAATGITSSSFIANWQPIPNALSYLLLVERQVINQSLQEFLSFPPVGWSATGATGSSGRVLFNAINENLRTPAVSNPTEISFDLRQTDLDPNFDENIIILSYSTNSGVTWFPIESFNENSLPMNVIQNFTVDLTLFQNLSNVIFRFQKDDGSANEFFLDNVAIKSKTLVPVTTPNYNDLNVGNVTTFNVTGLVDFTEYQYSVKAVRQGNTLASNIIKVKTSELTTIWNGSSWSNGLPSSTRIAVINGNYSTTPNGNFTAKDLVINPGFTLTISPNGSVILDGDFINLGTSANMIVASNGNFVQRTLSPNVSGEITVRRNTQPLMRLDYVGWGSPVENQSLASFSPLTWGSRFYRFNTLTNNYIENNPYSNGLDTDFQQGRGYLIRMPNNHPITPTVWQGEFKGVPNTGIVNVTMINQGSGKNNNFIANPYPSAISISRFINENSSQIDPTLWVWRKTNGAAGSAYYTWAGNIWSNAVGPGDDIAATRINVGQAFIVQARIGETSLRFTNNMREVFNGTSFRPANEVHADAESNEIQTENGDEKHIMWLKLAKDNEEVTSIALAYSTGATNGFDIAVDGKSFDDGDIEFTSLVNTTSLAVQQRALPFVTTDEVPLRFKTTIAGTYTISLSGMTGLFLGDQNIYLRDMLTNVIHDLKLQDYTFTSVSGSFDNRFKIVYENATLGVDTFNPQNGVIAFVDAKVLNVTSVNQTIEKVVVFDISGRKVVEQQKVNATNTQLPLSGIARQMLLVQITTDLGVFTKKVVF
jgi:hypothetical protein